MAIETHVHLDKNLEPDGRWLLTVIIEKVENEKAEVVSQTNLYFDNEPQIQYRDWTKGE